MPRRAPATPRRGEAARDEQTRGTIGGTLGGAALGAIMGAAGGNAGLGAAAGAGAGLLAGTAIGADNARHAASDVQAAYADAYYACMHEDQRAGCYGDRPPPGYAAMGMARRLAMVMATARRRRPITILIPIITAPAFPSASALAADYWRRGSAAASTAAAVAPPLGRSSALLRAMRPGLYGPGRFLWSAQVFRCRPKPIPPSSIPCNCAP